MRLLALILVVAGGAGGFLLGRAGSPSLGDARAEGARAGAKAGKRDADRSGYREGFDVGRKRGYLEQYEPAYRQAFRLEFKGAGYSPPKRVEVPGA
jgi:hypothetical protein